MEERYARKKDETSGKRETEAVFWCGGEWERECARSVEGGGEKETACNKRQEVEVGMKFIIISCGLWNLDHLITNVNSVNSQTVTDWRHYIVIDDMPEERPVLHEYAGRKFYLRKGRYFDLENTIFAISDNSTEINDDDVICIVNLDDSILSNALETVKKIYEENPGALLTYGSYVHLSGKPGRFAEQYFCHSVVRVSPWRGAHFRTFKFKLWKAIPDEYLRGRDGKYYHTSSDLATSFAMMEIAGLERCVFNPEKVYIYNDMNPANDHKVRRQEQISAEKHIRQRDLLERIDL